MDAPFTNTVGCCLGRRERCVFVQKSRDQCQIVNFRSYFGYKGVALERIALSTYAHTLKQGNDCSSCVFYSHSTFVVSSFAVGAAELAKIALNQMGLAFVRV